MLTDAVLANNLIGTVTLQVIKFNILLLLSSTFLHDLIGIISIKLSFLFRN